MVRSAIIVLLLSIAVQSQIKLSTDSTKTDAFHPIGLACIWYSIHPNFCIIGIGINNILRKNEYEADRYSAETCNGNDLQEALRNLSVNNLSNPAAHPAFVFMRYSHPPLVERLRALRPGKDKKERITQSAVQFLFASL